MKLRGYNIVTYKITATVSCIRWQTIGIAVVIAALIAQLGLAPSAFSASTNSGRGDAVRRPLREELERRPFLGLSLKVLSVEQRDKLKLSKDEGVLVSKVFPNSSAADAGVLEGDIVLRLNDKPVSSPDQLIELAKTCKKGQTLSFDTLSNSVPMRRTAAVKLFPVEESADFEIIYGSVLVDGSLRRTIVTRPKKPGKYPAVLLVGGIGCYSVDFPPGNNNPYKLILYGLARKNFVTMRVEKSGMGDSQGPPCSGEDFHSQIRIYEEALNSLNELDYVDKNKIFVFGHSIGGIVAPLLAEKFPLCGIMVAETVGISWFEYELENARRQFVLDGMAPEKIDAQMRLKELCLHGLLVEKKSIEQLLKQYPEGKEHLSYPADYKYLQQVADLNLPELWKSVKCPVLAIYGTSDFITSEREHKAIIDEINAAHPGNGTLYLSHGMDHYLLLAKTMQASYKRTLAGESGKFNALLTPAVYNWLHKVCIRAN